MDPGRRHASRGRTRTTRRRTGCSARASPRRSSVTAAALAAGDRTALAGDDVPIPGWVDGARRRGRGGRLPARVPRGDGRVAARADLDAAAALGHGRARVRPDRAPTSTSASCSADGTKSLIDAMARRPRRAPRHRRHRDRARRRRRRGHARRRRDAPRGGAAVHALPLNCWADVKVYARRWRRRSGRPPRAATSARSRRSSPSITGGPADLPRDGVGHARERRVHHEDPRGPPAVHGVLGAAARRPRRRRRGGRRGPRAPPGGEVLADGRP